MLTGILKFISLIIFHLWKSPSTLVSFHNLNNYFRLHVCLSFRTYVRPSVRHTFIFFQFPAVASQNVTNKSCLACVKSEKYASWVTISPQWECCCRGEAEVRIIDFKTTWSEFQMPSQTAPAEAKPRYVYSISKPQGQRFIISSELVSGQRSKCQVRLLPPRRGRGAYAQF